LELGIAFPILLLAKRVSQGTWMTFLLVGPAGIFACYALAYTLTDGLVSH
jgi:hypothetical protein